MKSYDNVLEDLIEEHLRRADKGNAVSQHAIGLVYKSFAENANHVDERSSSYNKARGYFELAARQNLHSALFVLGELYDQGLGVMKDSSKALYYYEKAAKMNNAPALYKLGTMYFNGFGVPKDLEKAKELITKAAELGHEKAKLFLDNYFTE